MPEGGVALVNTAFVQFTCTVGIGGAVGFAFWVIVNNGPTSLS